MAVTLWLIGMMGSGKSTVAPLVAAALDREWVDTDDAVENIAGRRIADLFAESEAAFRDVEAEVIDELVGSETVVACGGGVVTQPALTEAMVRSGVVVWLRATAETLVGRVGAGTGRPLLGGDPTTAIERLLTERGGLYRAAAGFVVDTDGSTPEEIAAEVVSAWNASSEE